jgi:hypothetical protein
LVEYPRRSPVHRFRFPPNPIGTQTNGVKPHPLSRSIPICSRALRCSLSYEYSADGDAGVGLYWGELRRTASVTWPELRALLSDHRWSATTEHEIRASRAAWIRLDEQRHALLEVLLHLPVTVVDDLDESHARPVGQLGGPRTTHTPSPAPKNAAGPTHRRPGPVHRLRTHRCRPRTRDLVGISVPEAAAWSRCASAGSLSSVWHDRCHDLTTRRPGPDLAR